MTKRIISLAISLVMIFNFIFVANADESSSLKFNESGKFRIMLVNDTHDDATTDKRLINGLKAAIESEKPDLVVFNGDIFYERFFNPTKETLFESMHGIFQVVEDAKVPFALTFGNHDTQYGVSAEELMNYCTETFDYCVAAEDGCDAGTYNIPVYSDNGKIIFNVYLMDTHSKDENGDYDGVSEEQIKWYEAKSDELKALNGGVPVPSYVFEHIPVRQINSILKEVPFGTENATFTPDGYKIVDPDKHLGGNFYEYPNPTGDETNRQYESWVEKGDVVAAFFGHDHTNSFYGKTDEGIILGYNASFGWKAYGMGGATRQVKMIVVDENDPRNPEIYSKSYKDLTGENGGYGPIDFISPWTYNVIINNTIGKIFALISLIFG